ncbi:MAG: pyridoxal phosphate-dependent aminotransferase [Rhodospirillales bacterium]|nr:pyridoxal phosphate-dependent aminotransferase [Alphaproteobacteria bacterium]MBL6947452.1 pyridoxal phosphate-dependent aminotransferase [Rhodospirillales bacterium]
MSDPLVSENVSGMVISAIKEMAIRSAKIPDVASLAWGLPSFRTPEHIRRAVEQRLETDPDIGKYALPDGLAELRRAAANTHFEATGIETDPDRNVMITAGNMQGVNALLHVLLDPGDEVIVTDPGFASHFQQIRLCGGVPVYWKMDEDQGWRLDIDALPDLITARTKAIILVTPSNPTGRIFSEQELRHIGQIARERNFLIILDDPYCHFTYENEERYFNLSSVPELSGHVAYLFTFSKTHAMSGWRLGFMIVPEHLKGEVLKVHDATLICTPRISQIAGLAALSEPPVHLKEFEDTLAGRRTLICERLDGVGHVFAYVKPEGAYYVFPRILVDHEDSFEFSIHLLEEANVCVTPGSAFGPTGEHHVRMAFCVSEDAINLAFDRIERYFPR